MTQEAYFETRKTVHDFKDGETVYLHVDGTGEVVTTYRYYDSAFGEGYLFDAEGGCYGTLKWWLETNSPMNLILAPPDAD